MTAGRSGPGVSLQLLKLSEMSQVARVEADGDPMETPIMHTAQVGAIVDSGSAKMHCLLKICLLPIQCFLTSTDPFSDLFF